MSPFAHANRCQRAHLSPDGTLPNYISFPMGALGHPADLEVEVRLVRTADRSHIVQRLPLFGGQGTINVNSWSPDGRRFGYVAYPVLKGTFGD